MGGKGERTQITRKQQGREKTHSQKLPKKKKKETSVLLKNKKLIRKQLLLAQHVKVGEKNLELCVALGSALTPFPCQHFISPLTSPKFHRPFPH